MRRKTKLKIKKSIIVVTTLLFILFAVFLIKEKFNEHTFPPQDEMEGSVNNHEPEGEEKIPEEPGKEPAEEAEKPPVEEKPEPEQPPEESEQGITIQNPENIDVLVNKKRNLPDTYVPEDLVTLSEVPTVLLNPEVNQLRSAAYEALKKLFGAANEEEGYVLCARSGYRSYNTQASLYSSYVASYGEQAADKYSAKAGQSEHQTGLSIDITCEAMNYTLDTTFAETEEGKWVSENAHRFGYIVRYPKGKEVITGYSYEPWHIRYLGIELATEVYESGLTMEEYFE